MAGKGSKTKKCAAACIGSGMMLAALVFAQDYQSSSVMAEETAQEETTSLSIAGKDEQKPEEIEGKDTGTQLQIADPNKDTEEDMTEETETEEPTEAATEAVTEDNRVYETLETTNADENAITAMDVSGIVDNCMPSIVSITSKSVQDVENYFYGTQEIETEGAGSGIIVAQNSKELLIATNKHVVAGTQELTVCFSVDTENPEDAVVKAVTKGTDAEYDLAVVAVKLADIPEDVLSKLKIATLGSSDDLKVGETAIVIGNALGVGQTVTCGIVSALEREITTEVGTFTEFQTDAAINFGCSGGAVLNKKGEVIGISSAKATSDYAESMGYAIPIDSAIPVLTNLINRETREEVDDHGFMGITVVPVSQEAKEMYNMPAGAYVYEVAADSAGEKAGLKKGDIITRFDGISIDSSETLVDTLAYYKPGETVTIEIQQAEGGEYSAKELEVTLQEGAKDTSADKKDDSQQEQAEPNNNNSFGYDDQFSDEDMRNFFDYFMGQGNGGFGGF